MKSRRAFQAILSVLGLVPIVTGAVTVLGGVAFTGVAPTATLDSDYRFFGGLWFGLGLAIFWLVPRPERHAALFRAIAGAIFVGGLARLLSLTQLGWPDAWSTVAIGLELVAAPAMVLWHRKTFGIGPNSTSNHTDDHTRP